MAVADEDPVTWLTSEELDAWLSIVRLITWLPWSIDQQLQHDANLAMTDYQVLAMLSESPELRMRMSSLAEVTNASLSRLSHLVKRLEARGLVRREPDPSDGRFTIAILTDAGTTLLVSAAPCSCPARQVARRRRTQPRAASPLGHCRGSHHVPHRHVGDQLTKRRRACRVAAVAHRGVHLPDQHLARLNGLQASRPTPPQACRITGIQDSPPARGSCDPEQRRRERRASPGSPRSGPAAGERRAGRRNGCESEWPRGHGAPACPRPRRPGGPARSASSSSSCS